MARHSTPDLTMNIYAKTRTDRLATLAEKVGETVLSGRECATDALKLAAGAESLSANVPQVMDLRDAGTGWRRGESNPRPVAFRQKLLRV